MCHLHNHLFTLDHIEHCELLIGCDVIRRFAYRLREEHILEWRREDRLVADHPVRLINYSIPELSGKEGDVVSTDGAANSIRKEG
jgi:hypothetical protein